MNVFRRPRRSAGALLLGASSAGLLLGASLLGPGRAAAQDRPADALPKRPEELAFAPLAFELPDPGKLRHVLPSGVPCYVSPNRSLPLVKISFTFRGGRYLDAPGAEGVAGAMGSMLRRGGTKSHAPSDFDDALDFLAANVGAGTSEYRTEASLDVLTRNLEQALPLFIEMLRAPRFDAERLRLYKQEVLEALKQRNDDAGSILGREWSALMYGPTHFKGRQPTKASVEALDEAALRAFHARVVHPGNLVIGVTGDVDPKEITARLEAALAGWAKGERVPDPPAEAAQPAPGVYRVEKDIPQGKVYIGHRGVQRDHPDAIALRVLSEILGSGGFTSRITKRVRSDEGLAYDAHAVVIPGLYFPGEFRAAYQSKSRTVALAAKLVLEEVAKVRAEPVTAQELETAKGSIIEGFPQTFGSPAATVGLLVEDELTGRSFDYYRTYRDKVRALTAADLLRVAKEQLHPEKMAILVVGKWEEIAPGDLEGRASMKDLFEGKVTVLPLRDPLTLEPLQ